MFLLSVGNFLLLSFIFSSKVEYVVFLLANNFTGFDLKREIRTFIVVELMMSQFHKTTVVQFSRGFKKNHHVNL